jgi:uncharacterized alpha-E superfamily protein
MLSRVAESIYWMSRYLERAENTARFVEVNWHLSLDMPVGEGGNSWEALVHVTGDAEAFHRKYGGATAENTMQFLTFDSEYPNSVVSCLMAARENARSIRERISPEMWESINAYYHLVAGLTARPPRFDEHAFDFYRRIKLAGMQLGGIADDTLNHDEVWHFFRLGRFLERADKTTRILDVKYFLLLPGVNYVGSPLDDLQWSALLRSTSALEAYRQRYGRTARNPVIQFLLLDRAFPRAVASCLLNADYSLRAISGTPAGTYRYEAERELGQVCARLSYLDVEEIIRLGLHEFLDTLQLNMNRLDDRLREQFFAAGAGVLAESLQ